MAMSLMKELNIWHLIQWCGVCGTYLKQHASHAYINIHDLINLSAINLGIQGFCFCGRHFQIILGEQH